MGHVWLSAKRLPRLVLLVNLGGHFLDDLVDYARVEFVQSRWQVSIIMLLIHGRVPGRPLRAGHAVAIVRVRIIELAIARFLLIDLLGHVVSRLIHVVQRTTLILIVHWHRRPRIDVHLRMTTGHWGPLRVRPRLWDHPIHLTLMIQIDAIFYIFLLIKMAAAHILRPKLTIIPWCDSALVRHLLSSVHGMRLMMRCPFIFDVERWLQIPVLGHWLAMLRHG